MTLTTMVFAAICPRVVAESQQPCYVYDPLGSGWTCLRRTDMEGISMRAGFYPDGTPVTVVGEKDVNGYRKVFVKIGSVLGWVLPEELTGEPILTPDSSSIIKLPCFRGEWAWVRTDEKEQAICTLNESEYDYSLGKVNCIENPIIYAIGLYFLDIHARFQQQDGLISDVLITFSNNQSHECVSKNELDSDYAVGHLRNHWIEICIQKLTNEKGLDSPALTAEEVQFISEWRAALVDEDS